ncbi:unnamed protein product [Rotaria sp. Silwood1]|nr:unnamed protein product [Rotaria sp. Silwood1]CAF5075806.1 unnamed protein product [Rotaria sp. Silwood1]
MLMLENRQSVDNSCQVDKRTLEKYQNEAREKSRESWYLSWALDTNEEEREKRKTVEVGRAWFETEKKTFYYS